MLDKQSFQEYVWPKYLVHREVKKRTWGKSWSILLGRDLEYSYPHDQYTFLQSCNVQGIENVDEGARHRTPTPCIIPETTLLVSKSLVRKEIRKWFNKHEQFW